MGGNLVRVVHPQTTFAVLPIEQVAPDVQVFADQGGEAPRKAVVFSDPDGEMHIYPLSERALSDLHRMTGESGIVITSSLPEPFSRENGGL